MGLESATYIADLVTTNPVGATDPKSQGDDHIRLIKTVLQNTFPGAAAPYTLFSCDFRLTLSSGNPVPTADVIDSPTLYLTPYCGNSIVLYDGTKWVRYSSAEMSIDIPDADALYDVFCYSNAGVPTLELTAWASTTARATALVRQDGILVKSGAATRRYIGSFLGQSTGAGVSNDTEVLRLVWNYYNRVHRLLRRLEQTDSWTYNGSYRQANNSALNQISVVVGVAEDVVCLSLRANALISGTATAYAGIGLDVVNAFCGELQLNAPLVSGQVSTLGTDFNRVVAIGLHYLAWVEYSSTNVTWYGDGGAIGGSVIQSGMTGYIRA